MTNLPIFKLQHIISKTQVSCKQFYSNKDINVIEIYFSNKPRTSDIVMHNFCSDEEVENFLSGK